MYSYNLKRLETQNSSQEKPIENPVEFFEEFTDLKMQEGVESAKTLNDENEECIESEDEKHLTQLYLFPLK